MTDFAELFWRLLPGIYRHKDTHGDLSRFLRLMAVPAAEIEQSIADLYRDLFLNSSRLDFLPLFGDLLGVVVDGTQPESLQRATLAIALDYYRSKGLEEPLVRAVEALTGWVATSVDYSQVVARAPCLDAGMPTTGVARAFDLRDPSSIKALGRSDDAASYTFDIRTAPSPTASFGRAHFDNHGLFLTVSRTIANQRPTLFHFDEDSGYTGFTFDAHPFPRDRGHQVQLLDGLDGEPLTRARLHRNVASFLDTRRGFTIRDLSVPLSTLPKVTFRAANLTDVNRPRQPDDETVGLGQENHEVAVDPELGKFRLKLDVLGLRADRLRVGYLVAPAQRFTRTIRLPLDAPLPTTYSFAPDGNVLLRDGFDGTPLAHKFRSGSIKDLHKSDRGWRMTRKGKSLDLNPERRDLADPNTTVPSEVLGVDLERGRFAVPPGFLEEGDELTVEYSTEDTAATSSTFSALAQRLTQMVPAGATPVLVDTRGSRNNLRNLP